ncbi:MAG TPA: response regulator [Candidatus Acidoferrum sp.]|jgi:CheY-like chemotaxis protein
MTHRILVVEDNPANRELLCDWLEMEDYEVQSAEDLTGAFTLFNGGKFDAVLLDVQLGREDGLAFPVQVRQQAGTRQVPIIAVTAHAMITDHERVLQAGCNACISKPIDFKLLRQQLQQWLALTNTSRQHAASVEQK